MIVNRKKVKDNSTTFGKLECGTPYILCGGWLDVVFFKCKRYNYVGDNVCLGFSLEDGLQYTHKNETKVVRLTGYFQET